ncbi:MAG: A/G-specific adenine glycosylase [Deltaproteobacteria bacterium]|nr:A/G-specific adenine glycosylase [Nannocystaceae bacterium]
MAFGSEPVGAGEIAAALAPWFIAHQRTMSWRGRTDPYAIWVSEVMLQQTRVETVERYYTKFLDRFPDTFALAAADDDAVLAAWSGLGYYRRARMLHLGAKVVAERFGGRMPEQAEQLREIPGIGPYTAGAIASIAFDRPEPLVDGNVARVLSRVNAIEDVARQGANAKQHWQLVAEIVREGSPRVLAQALMELGATVCTPRSPRCMACPLFASCRARKLGIVDRVPAPKQRGVLPRERWWALAIVRDERLLVVRRPGEGLLAGMWCLPLVAIDEGDVSGAPDPALLRAAIGVDAVLGPAHAVVEHVFTHLAWELYPVRCDVGDTPVLPGIGEGSVAWIAGGERPHGGVPSVLRKLLRPLGWAA